MDIERKNIMRFPTRPLLYQYHPKTTTHGHNLEEVVYAKYVYDPSSRSR